MSRLKTILLCALAIAAIAFLAIYEPLTRSTREHAADARKGLVLHLDPSKVREIRISTGVSKFEIKRSGNGWQLGTKSNDRADSALVERMLLAAAGMRYFDRIAGQEFKADSELSDYGLRNPKRTIEFDGEESATLFLGKDAVIEERIYVRTSGSRDVYLVSDELLKLAFRDIADFRAVASRTCLPTRLIASLSAGKAAKSSCPVMPLAGRSSSRSVLSPTSKKWTIFLSSSWPADRRIYRRRPRRLECLWHRGGEGRNHILRRG